MIGQERLTRLIKCIKLILNGTLLITNDLKKLK